jgi:hypothetical protein
MASFERLKIMTAAAFAVFITQIVSVDAPDSSAITAAFPASPSLAVV